jgi:polyribonucleotide nucleotidyltransferase
MIKNLGIDPKTKKDKVTRKALLPRPPRDENAPARAVREPRPERRDDRRYYFITVYNRNPDS